MARPKRSSRSDLAAASLGERLGRDLSTQSVLLHTAIAQRLGLAGTDHKYLDVIARAAEKGPVTPGDLVRLTGLTSGGVTGVLDRLEQAGFIRRAEHPSDRRALVVEPIPARYAEIGALFAPFREHWAALCARYSAAELDLITDFFERSIALMTEEVARLQQPASAAPPAPPAGAAARARRPRRSR